jgi:hypothetical protein
MTDGSEICINTFTIRFEGCRDIYAFLVVKPTNRFFKTDLPQQSLIKRVLTDASENKLLVKRVIADAKLRAEWRGFTGPDTKNGCDLCYSSSVQQFPMDGIGYARKCWTTDCLDAPLRTQDDVERILPKLHGRTPNVLRLIAKGIAEHAAILDFPGLDVIDSIVVEPMNMLNLGNGVPCELHFNCSATITRY